MNGLIGLPVLPRLPPLITTAGERASLRFVDFFAANIRNPHTRRAYDRAAEEFLAWCASIGVPSIAASGRCMSAPGSKPRRASSPHRASSNGSQRSATCAIG